MAQVAQADGVIISSPEYVRAIPGGMKNLIDWMVSRAEIITSLSRWYTLAPWCRHAGLHEAGLVDRQQPLPGTAFPELATGGKVAGRGEVALGQAGVRTQVIQFLQGLAQKLRDVHRSHRGPRDRHAVWGRMIRAALSSLWALQ
jgi:hypothetical protein